MKKVCVVLVVAGMVLAVAALSGCTTVGGARPFAMGSIYADYNSTIDTEFNNTDLGSKVGTAEATSILGLVATGDCSAAAAAKAGGIKVIKHADCKVYNLLGIISKVTMVVYGD